MAKYWLRPKVNNQLSIHGGIGNNFFLSVQGFQDEPPAYLLNDVGNINAVGSTINPDLTYDFGFMSLPAETAMLNYQLTDGVLKSKADLDNVLNTLNGDFFGKVIFDIQSDVVNNSKFFRNATSFDLCNDAIKTGNAWSRLGGCQAVATSRLVLHNGLCITKPEISILKAPVQLFEEDKPGAHYYLVPMLLPEKQFVFWAMKESDEEIDVNGQKININVFYINEVWFKKIKTFLDDQTYINNIDYHLVMEAGTIKFGKSRFGVIERNDQYGFSYVSHDAYQEHFSVDRIVKQDSGTYIRL